MNTKAELNYPHFLEKLSQANVVGLTAPAGADGDSVGTQCALWEMLSLIFPNKKIKVINEEACPVRYQFLPQTKHFETSLEIVSQDKSLWPDVMICVDGNESRIGEKTTLLWNHASLRGQVDHHAVGHSGPYDLRLFDPQAASTTEIVFNFLKSKSIKLNPTLAQAIYVGLIFDTGLFKHSNTKPSTMRIGAELLEAGFDHTYTVEKAMLERSAEGLELLKVLLANHKKEWEGRYVWSALSHENFISTKAHEDDKEGLIDSLFLTRNCEVAAFYFERKPQDWKVSFRSRNGWDVAALAQSLSSFGGGHRAAAGCSLKGEQSEVLKRCHEAVKKMLNV